MNLVVPDAMTVTVTSSELAGMLRERVDQIRTIQGMSERDNADGGMDELGSMMAGAFGAMGGGPPTPGAKKAMRARIEHQAKVSQTFCEHQCFWFLNLAALLERDGGKVIQVTLGDLTMLGLLQPSTQMIPPV